MGWISIIGSEFTSVSQDISNYFELPTPGSNSGFVYILAHVQNATSVDPIIEVVFTDESGAVVAAEQYTLSGLSRKTAATNGSGNYITGRQLIDLANLKPKSTSGGSRTKAMVGVINLSGATGVTLYGYAFSAPGGRS